MSFGWRALAPKDIPAMVALAAIVHPGFPEDDDVLAERLALYPQGCFALEDGDLFAGYLLSHPWRAFDPPPLNRLLGALPAVADTYYIHDLALHPAVRGRGAAAPVLARIFAATAGYPSQSLVAVNNSGGFWARHGFAVIEQPRLAAKLSAYGADARYMMRRRA